MTEGRGSARGPLLIAVVAGGTFLAPVNSTMIAVALPSLSRDLGVGIGTVSWVVTVYLVVMASLQPVAGRLGDLFGHKRMFVGGCAALVGASIACALAPTFAALVVFRALQAVAAAVMGPNGAALVRHGFPAELRGRAFGWLAACMSVGAAIGPALGGFLVHAFGWSSIFWVNLLILAVVLPLAIRLLPETERQARARVDYGGALTLVLVAGVLALTSLHRTPAVPIALAAATVLLGFALFRWERRQESPVVQFGLFRHPAFAASSGAVLLSNLMMYTTLLLVPIFLARLQGRGPADIGWTLVSFSALMALASPVGGHLSDRFGRALPVVLGNVLALGGTFLLMRADRSTSLLTLAGYLAVSAVGAGLQMGAQQ